jgi:catechol 2,3-dioxygenase-like lactoylglutathione lyase family enzyme
MRPDEHTLSASTPIYGALSLRSFVALSLALAGVTLWSGRGGESASATRLQGVSASLTPAASMNNDDDHGPDVSRTGLMKSTWPVSSPLNTTYPFMQKYLSTYDNDDNCADNTCSCGEQSRVSLRTSTRAPYEFSLHGVRAAGASGARWTNVGGAMDVVALEKIFVEELGDFDVYSPWMDYATALYAPSLEPYLAAFKRDSVPHLRLRWRAGPSPAMQGEYYSVIVAVPDTLVIFELISNTTGSSGSVTDDAADEATVEDGFMPTNEPRHLFYGTPGTPGASAPADRGAANLQPLHVSRAVSNLSETIAWYYDIFGLAPVAHARTPNGAHMAAFQFPTPGSMEPPATLQYIERAEADTAGMSSSARSTRWLESVLSDAVKNAGMGSGAEDGAGCFPVWGDLHVGINNVTQSTGRTLDHMILALRARNQQEYHAFLGAENGYATYQPYSGTGHTTLNILEPSGWMVQVGGVYTDPPASTNIDWGNFEGYCFTDQADGGGEMQFTCS